MTVTDQITTDLPCTCGCGKWDHKQGRATCKHCGCTTYDPATDPEVARLREEQEHLVVEVANLRRVNVKLGRAEADNERLNRAVSVLAAERDTARAEAVEVGNELAKVRAERNAACGEVARLTRRAVDAEAALVEANEARRMRDSDHLHERIGAAALVISRERAGMCLRCRDLDPLADAAHGCGPLTPVDVIIARRPNPPTTEEQP